MTITYVLLHTRSQKYRQQLQEQTWLTSQKYVYYSDHEDDNVICVSDDTTYESAEVKFVNMFNQMPEKYHTEWLCFADNDTFINTVALEDYVSTADKSAIHGQIINCWPNDTSLFYPSGGAGFIIHLDTYIKLKGLFVAEKTGFSDVTFGINLKRLQVSMYDPNLFFSWPPYKYGHSDTDVTKMISYHYIKSEEEMVRLYDLVRPLVVRR